MDIGMKEYQVLTGHKDLVFPEEYGVETMETTP